MCFIANRRSELFSFQRGYLRTKSHSPLLASLCCLPRDWTASPIARRSRADLLAAIRRMGLLQIDTIHVVARSPYLVLWSRLGDYQPAWLDELLAEGALFEYWAHAICFLPIEDYPLYRRLMLDAIQARRWPTKWAVQYVQGEP